MLKKILIIGGGISGIACANSLKHRHEVLILEKSDSLGGLTAQFSCKATDTCNYCGWCLVNENQKEFDNNKVTILLGSKIKKIKKSKQGFKVDIVKINSPENIKSFQFDNIIFATGARPFDASMKPRFGYGKFKNVLTGYDLERSLRTEDFSGLKEIAFIQCVGSRDENINAMYCSKICCRYAVRMANYLIYKYPDLNVTIFYMDMQVQGVDINSV